MCTDTRCVLLSTMSADCDWCVCYTCLDDGLTSSPRVSWRASLRLARCTFLHDCLVHVVYRLVFGLAVPLGSQGKHCKRCVDAIVLPTFPQCKAAHCFAHPPYNKLHYSQPIVQPYCQLSVALLSSPSTYPRCVCSCNIVELSHFCDAILFKLT